MALLGIEGGASSSKGILQLENKSQIELKFEPANFTLLSLAPDGLQQFFEGVRGAIEELSSSKEELTREIVIEKVAIGLPGILSDTDKTIVIKIASAVWPKVKKVWVGSDIQVAFNCLERISTSKVNFKTVSQSQSPVQEFNKKCVIICGTGSVGFGKIVQRTPADLEVMTKVGGNGHLIGDRGSGYSIGLQALRLSMKNFERTGTSPTLLIAMMSFLKLNNLTELINWSVKATKTEIASLAKIVTQHWIEFKDELAGAVISEAVTDLSIDFKALIQKLNEKSNSVSLPECDNILIGLTGSLLTECTQFSQLLTEAITKVVEQVDTTTQLEFRVIKDTVRGALGFLTEENSKTTSASACDLTHGWATRDTETELRAIVLPVLTDLPTTELRNENSMNLDKMTEVEGIELMLSEEGKIYAEIRKEKDKIAELITRITTSFREGGRLFYVGAGTSGRLGILDASECPPTFKAPPTWVQGIIAGGTQAVFQAVEGAEDSVIGGTLAIKAKEMNHKDIVLGIAASGRTPFVWGALYEAKKSGAFTALLTFNPNLDVQKLSFLDMLVAINVGPEILTGSTRLKSGTATKTVLNMLTTLSMVKYGKCLENLMVDVMASNEKLKDRAARIALTILQSQLPRLTKEQVILSLQRNQFDIKKTVADFRLENKIL